MDANNFQNWRKNVKAIVRIGYWYLSLLSAKSWLPNVLERREQTVSNQLTDETISPWKLSGSHII